MKTSKFSSDFGLHLERDNTRSKWIIQSTAILLLLLVTTATIMVFHFTRNSGKKTPRELQPPTAEKLVATEVITDQLKQQNDTPEGFKNELKGPHPSTFASATASPVIITPRNPNYPKNIREIIDHLQGREGRTDPFHLYKPENPSDVNLLAVNNVRFAPPVWASLRSAPKRRGEENSTLKLKGSELLRSEIFPPGSVGGFPRTLVRLNVYSKRHKKRNPIIIFPSNK